MVIFEYLMMFSRLVIGITFAMSVVGKLWDFSAFKTSIENFRLLPKGLVLPVALISILFEIVVIIFVGAGDQFLYFGFGIALILLLIFTIALITLLIRKIKVSCNCFGKTKDPVTSYDIVRNGVFILCALTGLVLSAQAEAVNISYVEISTLTLFAFIFTLLNINLSQIAALFKA